MGRQGYPPELRRKVLDLEPGLTSAEKSEPAMAKRYIAELCTIRWAMEPVRLLFCGHPTPLCKSQAYDHAAQSQTLRIGQS
jgi:hypothetical protein